MASSPTQLESNPSNVKALTLRASSQMKKKAYARAIEDYNKLLLMQPDVRDPKCWALSCDSCSHVPPMIPHRM